MAEQPTRREFLGLVGRGTGLLAVAGLGLHLVVGRDGEKVWQLDPSVCDGCLALNTDAKGQIKADGTAVCSTHCVLKLSAVKAVNEFTKCGYCRICPAYQKSGTPPETNRDNLHDYGTPTGRVCPYDAIKRTSVGFFDEFDFRNNFYEYAIDEAKCTGCGKCVVECGNPGQGNGSLRMEVRHNLCVDCNQCAIAVACPAVPGQTEALGYIGAFYRDDAASDWPAMTDRPKAEIPPDFASLPCGPSPYAKLSAGELPARPAPRRGDRRA